MALLVLIDLKSSGSLRPSNCISSTLRNVHPEPYYQGSTEAQSEQEWEPHPVVSSIIDNRLNDVGSDHRRRPIG